VTDEETREAIAELTNMPVEIEAIIRNLLTLANTEECPDVYGLQFVMYCRDGRQEADNCINCWLKALRYE